MSVKGLVLALTALGALVVTAGSASAVEPNVLLGGVWSVQETGLNPSPQTYFASIHQNGSTILFINIRLEGQWDVGVGTPLGSTVQGTVYFPNGGLRGYFTVTVTSPTTFTGEGTGPGGTSTLVGTKLF